MSRAAPCLILALGLGRLARGDDPLVAVAAAGHRQTIESIRTLQVRVRYEGRTDGKRPQRSVMDYWQDGDKKRVRNVSEGYYISNEPDKHIKNTRDTATRGGRNTDLESTLVEGRQPQNQARINNIDTATNDDYDHIWVAIEAEMTTRPHRWLKDMLDGPLRDQEKWKWEARREDLGGHPVIFLEGKSDTEHGLFVYRAWLDPATGYLPRKVITFGGINRNSEDNPTSRYEVTRFHPPYKKTGIRFPAEATQRWFATDGIGSTTIEEKKTFENVRINDPIPDETFDLKIPPNYWVIDRTGGGTTGPGRMVSRSRRPGRSSRSRLWMRCPRARVGDGSPTCS